MIAQSGDEAFRVRLGGMDCTVLSDGQVVSGDPRLTHPDADRQEVEQLLQRHSLPVDRLVFAENVLVLDHDAGLVMFDAGLGSPAEVPAWGTGAGHLAGNLARAGFDPRDICHVVLSHGLPSTSAAWWRPTERLHSRTPVFISAGPNSISGPMRTEQANAGASITSAH